MPSPRVYSHKVWEGADWFPADLFAYGDGTLPLHSELDHLDVRIYKLPELTLIHSFLGESVGDGTTGPWYNTPQLDAGWKQGPPGYNSKFRIAMATLEAASVVIEPRQVYRVELIYDGSAEGRLISVHEYTPCGLRSRP